MVVDQLADEILEHWKALKPAEKEQVIRQMRGEIPGSEEIAGALERHYLASQARA